MEAPLRTHWSLAGCLNIIEMLASTSETLTAPLRAASLFRRCSALILLSETSSKPMLPLFLLLISDVVSLPPRLTGLPPLDSQCSLLYKSRRAVSQEMKGRGHEESGTTLKSFSTPASICAGIPWCRSRGLTGDAPSTLGASRPSFP